MNPGRFRISFTLAKQTGIAEKANSNGRNSL
jgi:hypothetical protein